MYHIAEVPSQDSPLIACAFLLTLESMMKKNENQNNKKLLTSK